MLLSNAASVVHPRNANCIGKDALTSTGPLIDTLPARLFHRAAVASQAID